jgi:hypothetical protein
MTLAMATTAQVLTLRRLASDAEEMMTDKEIGMGSV